MYMLLLLLIAIISFIVYIIISNPNLDKKTIEIIDETLREELPELIAGKTGFVYSNNIKIWYELISFINPERGVICLLMSNAADALMWPPSFINMLTSAGFKVIRFDYRGTGESDWIEDWNKNNAYSLKDMADDVIAIFDELKISAAHLIGFSLGGMIAQEIAINYSKRVCSLNLLMTSGDATDPKMKVFPIGFIISSLIKSIPILKYRIKGGERNLIIERVLRMKIVLSEENLNIKEIAQQVLYDLRNRKGINKKAVFQHIRAVTISGSRYDKLRNLEIPTLIIHGTKDKVLPIEHGKMLASIIPNAKHHWIEDVGHVFPVPNMENLINLVIEHISALTSAST